MATAGPSPMSFGSTPSSGGYSDEFHEGLNAELGGLLLGHENRRRGPVVDDRNALAAVTTPAFFKHGGKFGHGLRAGVSDGVLIGREELCFFFYLDLYREDLPV